MICVVRQSVAAVVVVVGGRAAGTPAGDGVSADFHQSCCVVLCYPVLCGVLWCGVVQCGAVWFGLMRCDVVWCGVVWCAAWCGVVCRRRCYQDGNGRDALHTGNPKREGCVSECMLCVVCHAPVTGEETPTRMAASGQAPPRDSLPLRLLVQLKFAQSLRHGAPLAPHAPV